VWDCRCVSVPHFYGSADLFAATVERRAERLFGVAVTVPGRGVETGDATLGGASNRLHRLAVVDGPVAVATHRPAAASGVSQQLDQPDQSSQASPRTSLSSWRRTGQACNRTANCRWTWGRSMGSG
jgi:hypothetical protein